MRIPPPIFGTIVLLGFCCAPLVASGQVVEVTLTPSDHNGYNISCFGLKDGAIDATVTVTKLVPGATMDYCGTVVSLVDAAAIDVDGIAVVLITNRQQCKSRGMFTNLGIDLATKRIAVVKSTNHFFAEFGPVAEEVLYTDAPGAIPRDFTKIPYTRIPRPIWPLDADPWAARGAA